MSEEKDKRYFAICRQDGGVEWFELYEDTSNAEEDYQQHETRVNYLRPDGSTKYLNKFVKSKDKTYLDIICPRCEAPMVLIPFSLVDEEERIRVFRMTEKERISFAEKYLILEGFEDD